jgi:3-hydroxyisobutyrate dehydrogenase-like beta-hydroxyacid dehydrogenase
MGSAMAPRLATAGYEVVAFDPADAGRAALVQAGGRFANSLIELGRQSDIVLLSLPTPQVVREVVLGESGLIHQRPRLVIDLSTSGPQVSAEIGRALDMAGIGFVDAPVSGGRAGALAGRLSLMVACARTIWAQVEALLAVFGRVFYVGTQAGQGQMMKLVNNLLSAAALAITSEGVALGVKAGLDPHTMIGVLNASSGANSATADKFPRAVLPRTFDFGFQTAEGPAPVSRRSRGAERADDAGQCRKRAAGHRAGAFRDGIGFYPNSPDDRGVGWGRDPVR